MILKELCFKISFFIRYGWSCLSPIPPKRGLLGMMSNDFLVWKLVKQKTSFSLRVLGVLSDFGSHVLFGILGVILTPQGWKAH